MNAIIPILRDDLNIRVATRDDLAWIDQLQKTQSKSLGFLQYKALEGKIALGQILIAETGDERIGYCIGQDRYFKRDDVGIIYQMNVEPGHQRGLVGATLLKAMFDRAAYGCRLFCCWCAQDLDANRFWEAMGFVPLAFRAGSAKKDRVHIFWQKKIRGNDDRCNWWFPSKTDQGAIREDRLVFPIPPGVHWREVKPILLEGVSPETPLAFPAARESRPPRKQTRPVIKRPPLCGGLSFALPVTVPTIVEKPKKEPRKKVKVDPKYASAARELRDRYLERVNEDGFVLEAAGKYELTRTPGENAARMILPTTPQANPAKLLAA